MVWSDGLAAVAGDHRRLRLGERHRGHGDGAAEALMPAAERARIGAANRGGGEDNITVVLFEVAETGTAAPDEPAQMPAVEPDVEDTLSEEDAVPTAEARPLLHHDRHTADREAAQLPAVAPPADGSAEPDPEPRRKRRR